MLWNYLLDTDLYAESLRVLNLMNIHNLRTSLNDA